jgi:hypothetical protein
MSSAAAFAGIGKDFEACELFYGPGDLADTDMLRSGMFGDIERILADNPDCRIYLFPASRPFGLLTMGFFNGGKGEIFTYMRLTETDGQAGTGPLSDAEIEALLLFNQSGGPWERQEEGIVDPVKAMWISGDGRFTAAYNDTGVMRALNIIPLKFFPSATPQQPSP